ncbi:damage-inducible protein J [Enterococcus casseliflavus]|nr:damage-inducible protein J [Enterococcus casseliflavus]
MEIDVEHILDCLDQYEKGELAEKQLTKALTHDEKIFLIMPQGLQEIDNDSEEEFDVLDWLGEEESFFMIVEVNESLCRQAESVLKEIGVEMPDAIGSFLKQLVETKQLPVAVND